MTFSIPTNLPRVDKETLKHRLMLIDWLARIAVLDGWQVRHVKTEDGSVLLFKKEGRITMTYDFKEISQIAQDRQWKINVRNIYERL